MVEKRKNKRLDLESQIILSRLDPDADSVVKTSILVKDVSKTGIGFECKESLSIGAIYECLLTIWTKETIHAFVEIVRVVKNDDSFVYGGIFIGMPETDMNRIAIYSTIEDNIDK